MKDTRNYGKLRFAVGGPVQKRPPPDPDKLENWSLERRMGDLVDPKYANDSSLELEANRKLSVEQKPDDPADAKPPHDEDDA